jgi:cellulose synthase/poly-beta-1,6-N-acetylglucosamine synthase-like glycosyltransferase
VLVCPGCATVYRSKVFDTLSIPVGTLAEDMDLTFHIQLNNLGKITFEEKACVVTQDPKSLRDFIKQIDRWYTGFWQCVSKHNIPWNGKLFDLEVAMLALEGLFNGLLIIVMAALIPFAFIKYPHLFYIPLFIDLFLFLIPTIIFIIIRHRHWNIVLHLPQFYFIRIICSLVFLISFFKVALNFDSKAKWNKAARYIS